jgi:cytidyltransferase-like protein
MDVFESPATQDFTDLQKLRQAKWPRVVVAFGNFDGAHLGHRQILEEAVRVAKKLGGTSVCPPFGRIPPKCCTPRRPPDSFRPSNKNAAPSKRWV